MKRIRNSNFELMRILSMLFIIIGHILLHGNFIANCGNPTLKIVLEIIMFFIIVHVNSYVLLMGYFQSKSKFKLSKLLKLLLQVIFFSTVLFLVCVKIGWIKNYTIVDFINSILPSTISNYWFVNAYIITYVLSDIINKIINKLSRQEYKTLLIVSFIVLSVVPYVSGYKILNNNGYTFYNFIYLYLIGGYLRCYPMKETYHFKQMSTNGYRMLLIFGFIVMAFLNYLICNFAYQIQGSGNLINEFSNRVLISKLNYSTPFVMCQSIVYFELFRTINIKSKFINFISSCTFGVYLFHEYPAVRDNIYMFLKIDNGIFYGYKKFLYMLLIAVLIFIIGMVIEMIRQLIFKLISKLRPVKFIITKFKSFINSFNFKINW